MVVDDSEFLQKIMISLIEKIKETLLLNFDIITASNGEEAFRFYKENHEDIKLILMDIQMPIMDGYQSAKNIREYE